MIAITTEVKAIAALVIVIGALSAFLAYSHHERDIGEKKIEQADSAALIIAKQKADEGTKANIEQATQADLGAEHDRKIIDDYVAAHPVGIVRLCRSANDRGPLLPATGTLAGLAQSPGAGPDSIREVPDANPSRDIGPDLDRLVRAAGRMATLYADRQRRDPGALTVK